MSDAANRPTAGADLATRRTDLAADRTRWAADRTYLAADRTLIAWLRTAITLVGFGFSIGKAGDALESQGIVVDDYHSLQVVGFALITVAVVGLVGAAVQQIALERRLAATGYDRLERASLGIWMAALLFILGIAGAVAIFV